MTARFKVIWLDSEGYLQMEAYASRTEAAARKAELARHGIDADIREMR